MPGAHRSSSPTWLNVTGRGARGATGVTAAAAAEVGAAAFGACTPTAAAEDEDDGRRGMGALAAAPPC